MNIDRMNELVRYLKTIDEYHFNISEWSKRDYERGTVRCAIGHAALNENFIQQGFSLIHANYEFYPHYNGLSGWGAVISFFDIDISNAKFLFDSGGYNESTPTTLSQVIERLTTFIKDNS